MADLIAVHIVPHDWNEGGILQENSWLLGHGTCSKEDHKAHRDCRCLPMFVRTKESTLPVWNHTGRQVLALTYGR